MSVGKCLIRGRAWTHPQIPGLFLMQHKAPGKQARRGTGEPTPGHSAGERVKPFSEQRRKTRLQT